MSVCLIVTDLPFIDFDKIPESHNTLALRVSIRSEMMRSSKYVRDECVAK